MVQDKPVICDAIVNDNIMIPAFLPGVINDAFLNNMTSYQVSQDRTA